MQLLGVSNFLKNVIFTRGHLLLILGVKATFLFFFSFRFFSSFSSIYFDVTHPGIDRTKYSHKRDQVNETAYKQKYFSVKTTKKAKMFGAAAVRKKRRAEAKEGGAELNRGPYIKPFGPRFDPSQLPYFKYKRALIEAQELSENVTGAAAMAIVAAKMSGKVLVILRPQTKVFLGNMYCCT